MPFEALCNVSNDGLLAKRPYKNKYAINLKYAQRVNFWCTEVNDNSSNSSIALTCHIQIFETVKYKQNKKEPTKMEKYIKDSNETISALTLFVSVCGPGNSFKISSIGRLKSHIIRYKFTNERLAGVWINIPTGYTASLKFLAGETKQRN